MLCWSGLLRLKVYNRSRLLSSHLHGKPYNEIPSPPKKAFIGHAHLINDYDLNWRMNLALDKLRKDHGSILKFQFPFMEDLLFIFDPNDVQLLLSADGKTPNIPYADFNYIQRDTLLKQFYPNNKGLTGSQGEEWYDIRSKSQQDMMRASSAYFYIGTITEVVDEFVESVDRHRNLDGEVKDLVELLDLWSFESIASIFIDKRYGLLDDDISKDSDGRIIFDYISKYLRGTSILQLFLFTQMIQTPLFNLLPPIVENANAPGLRGKLFKTILPGALNSPVYRIFFSNFKESLNRIQQQKTFREAHSNVTQVFDKDIPAPAEEDMEKSIVERLAEKYGFDSEVPAIIGTEAVLGGFDTTSATLSFLLYHLATNQTKQTKLYEEVVGVVGKTEELKKSHLNHLKYAKACLYESQRMDKWSGIGPIMRRNQKDVVLSGYMVPAGKWIIVIPQEDSIDQKFIPERWIRGNSEYIGDKISSFSNLPFGYGPRMCIGRRFAELEIYILLVRLLQRFKIEYHHEPIGQRTGIILKPDRALKLKFIDR